MSGAVAGQGRSLESFSDFYQESYGDSLRELHPAGRTGALLMLVEQGAGDWSDAPSPDLVVAMVHRRTASATIDLGAGRFSCRFGPGDFTVTAPGTATTILVDDRHELRLILVPYAALLALAGDESGLPVDGDFGSLHAALRRDRAMLDLVNNVWHETAGGSLHGGLYADGAMLQLAGHLIRLSGVRAGSVRGGLAPWQVRRVTEYLEDHLTDDVALADLAALTGLSTYHLCRAFKQSTGMPPHRWRLARRIERAREMLEHTEQAVTEVAAAVGYQDPSQLAAAFRKATGLSPTQYRRERRS